MPVRVAGAGSGGRFQKAPEGSGVCWYRFRRQVPEGSEGFRVPEASSGRFRRVPVCAGVSSGGRFRKVPEGSLVCRFWKVLEGSDVCWCRLWPEGSGGFRCALV